MGLLKERYAELRKGRVRYCCSQVWMKIGGRIPWNVTACCEIFRISCLTGRQERRFGEPFKGPILPLGSLVEYHNISTKDQSRIHQFGKKVLPGIFLGFVLYTGRIWKGDILVAGLEKLEDMDASEIHSKRLNAKEVMLLESGEEFILPVGDGTVKPSGGDQALKTSTLIRNQAIRRESHHDFLGESNGSPPAQHFQFISGCW